MVFKFVKVGGPKERPTKKYHTTDETRVPGAVSEVGFMMIASALVESMFKECKFAWFGISLNMKGLPFPVKIYQCEIFTRATPGMV